MSSETSPLRDAPLSEQGDLEALSQAATPAEWGFDDEVNPHLITAGCDGEGAFIYCDTDEDAQLAVALVNEFRAGRLRPASLPPTQAPELAGLDAAVWQLLRAWDGSDQLPEHIETALAVFEHAWTQDRPRLASAPAVPAPPADTSDRENLRKALAAIVDAADAMLNSLPGHWHDDATVNLTDAASDARDVLAAAAQDDLYTVPPAGTSGSPWSFDMEAAPRDGTVIEAKIMSGAVPVQWQSGRWFSRENMNTWSADFFDCWRLPDPPSRPQTKEAGASDA